MTPITDLIRALAAAGAPPEAIAIAVEAVEAVTATHRVAARDRKRRQRSRDGAGDVTGQDVTVTPQPSPGRSPSSPDPSNPPNPPSRQTARARRLGDDWSPAPITDAEQAAMLAAWPAGLIERELARFRDHWRASGGANARKHDWDAAWRNWLRKADDERPRSRETNRPDAGAAPGEPASAMVRAGLARLRQCSGA